MVGLQRGSDRSRRRVFRRGAKRIALSPQVRRALSCTAEVLDSDSLIQAILRADVTLFYNGGVGTYVRASDERDAEVGDHANDACRIAANELRVKAVAEGGNWASRSARASSTRWP